MKFLPEFETAVELAKSGKYDIMPVSCEILSDICTPIEAIMILKNVSTHCYMLESVADKSVGEDILSSDLIRNFR